jgi:hypothetical protein
MSRPLASQRLGQAERLIDEIRSNLTTGEPQDLGGFWISRSSEGTLFLDSADRDAYTATVDQLMRDFVKDGGLSRRSVESRLQDALFYSLDISQTRAGSFSERLANAIRTLGEELTAPAGTYRLWIPVCGLRREDLPYRFGATRFVTYGAAQERQLLAGQARPDKLRHLLLQLRGEPSWGQTCAVVDVEARDFESARVLAGAATRGALDCINFFRDLVPYNHGWLYMPGEAESTSDVSLGLSRDRNVTVSYNRAGPLLPFSLEQVRQSKTLGRQLRLVGDLMKTSKSGSMGGILLTSFQWCGRATVEVRREQSYLLFAIALEAAILPVQDEELNYRLGNRVAGLLGRGREERSAIRKSIGNLYKVRSAIVHSGSYEVSDEDLGRLRALTKRSLLVLAKRRGLWAMATGEFNRWLETLACK